MTNPPSAMPGAFNFHSRDNYGSQQQQPYQMHGNRRISNGRSGIFQPPASSNAPRTPSASSSMILGGSYMSISSGGNTGNGRLGKKRNLDDYHETGFSHTTGNGNLNGNYGVYGIGNETPKSYVDLGDEMSGISSGYNMRDGWLPGSPKPFVSTKYEVKGGLDTPGRMMEQAGENEYSDLGYRKSLGDGEVEMGTPYLRSDSEYFDLGESRSSQNFGVSPRADGLKAAISVVGDVIGKVWSFCSGAVFKGFQAGGGTRYQVTPTMNTSDSTFVAMAPDSSDFWESEKFGGIRALTPLPGQFPESDLIADYMDRPTPSPPRPAKRRQISGHNVMDENGGITKNWVVVPPTVAPPVHTPKSQPTMRNPPRFSMPTASSTSRRSIVPAARPASRASNPMLRRPAQQPSRVSHAGSPSLTTNFGASYASPRASPTTAIGSRLPRAVATPTRNGHASTASFSANSPMAFDSPAAKEARRWAALKKKEEREADESLSRLEKQLRDMIREGKEALGTKVSVEMEDDDETVIGGFNSRTKSPTSRVRSPTSLASRTSPSFARGPKKWSF